MTKKSTNELVEFLSNNDPTAHAFKTGTIAVNVVTAQGADYTITLVDFVWRIVVSEDGRAMYRLKQIDDAITDIPATYQFISFKLET